MSNKDYTKFSNNRNEHKVEEIQNGFPVVEEVVEEPVEEVVEPVVETKHGVITDCTRLNVRSEPTRDSEVVCVIDASTDIVIYEDESTEDFYKVCTASGAEGFCMKKFVTILP